MSNLVEVQKLKKHFPVTSRLFFSRVKTWVRAVDGIDFTIGEGETFGLVGESGCGKTTTTKLILFLEKPTSGKIFFRGEDITTLRSKKLRQYRASVQAVFQDPFTSLNPRMRVGTIVAQPLIANNILDNTDIRVRVKEVLDEVGLNPQSINLYPHEFSGGQRQRIAVARALAIKPSLVVLDEPVSALDVSIRAQIMNLLKDLQEKLGMSYLLIAHNLATIRYMSRRVAVMYLGKIVETAESEELFSNPLHFYTKALFSAALPDHPDRIREEIILPGEVPRPEAPPSGCRFHPRCWACIPRCKEEEPLLRNIGREHQVACHLV